MYDAREVGEFEVQNRYWPGGLMPLQTSTKQDWWLNIGISCQSRDESKECENVLTPKGIKLMVEIEKLIKND
jgi:hypothetical protein